MKKLIIALFAFLCVSFIHAEDNLRKDTLYTELKNDIVILSSTKETNSLKYLPASVSVFSPRNLEGMQIQSLKDLSSFAPNYFVADYGAKLTAPVYIRGVGARSGTQTIGFYIDNVPYFNTTSFDTELFDIQRVEILRGTQGTLYGRNAMGGILNIYTFSPLTYQGTKAQIGGGNYGHFQSNISHYQKINNTMGFSVAAFYNKHDGFFKNLYTGEKVDHLKNAGGRAKFEWNIQPNLSANYSISYDYVDQGAFPYANLATNQINYNSPGYYKRDLVTNGLSLRYVGQGYEINSTTGYQYLNDEMNMDQDYTPLSTFQINQRQIQNSLSQEVTIKSNNKSDYQWSNGVFGFYDYLKTTPPVFMMRDGIDSLLQKEVIGSPVKFIDDEIVFNGIYKRPAYGAAIFHQSTFNNIFNVKGLSTTLGLRLDYEKVSLDYNASTAANIKIQAGPMVIQQLLDTALIGRASDEFLELLPKAVLKYQINQNSFVYASASRGYKTGGQNIQIFADLLQEALKASYERGKPEITEEVSINKRISYKPEYTWNYEVGGKIDIIDNTLSSNFTLYYMDISDVQITQFLESGKGRRITNAGDATSKGFELGLKARPCKGFFLYANYGFTDARFKNYITQTKIRIEGKEKVIDLDYSGNRIPFAPRSTFSVGGSITYDLKNNTILDRLTLDTNFAGAGRIYWAEDNVMSQGFYGTLNSRLALEKNMFTLEFWGQNILDRTYNAFVFESMGTYFGQQGNPARWGASLKIKL